MISITASLDSLDREMTTQVTAVLNDEAKRVDRHWAVTVADEADTIVEWLFDNRVTDSNGVLTFDFDGTWEDAVEAQREAYRDAYYG